MDNQKVNATDVRIVNARAIVLMSPLWVEGWWRDREALPVKVERRIY